MLRLFGHYISKTFLLLGVLELFLFYGCLLGAYVIRTGLNLRFLEQPPGSEIHSSAVLYALLVSSSMIAMGLYQRGLQGAAALLVRLGVSFFLASMAMSLVCYALPHLFLCRGVFALSMIVSLAGLLLLRSVFFHFPGV